MSAAGWVALGLAWLAAAVTIGIAIGMSIRVSKSDETVQQLAFQVAILHRVLAGSLVELRQTGLARTAEVDEYLSAARAALGPDVWREITGED